MARSQSSAPNSPYADFAEAYQQAELEVESTLVAKWKNGCRRLAGAAAFLAKRASERWGADHLTV